jgi:hypothetical protein
MTDRYTIEYEVGDLLFEFTPAAGFKGDLAVTSGDATITLKTDLASAKGRTALIKECRDLYPEAFTLDELDFRRALNDLATHVDDEIKIRTAKAEEDDEEDEISDLAPEVGTDEYEAAMDILKSGNVLGRAAMAMRRLGHVGEWNNKKLAFLCSLSARAQLPVQPSTHAQSSAGKNYLWDKVLSLIPPELVYKRTGFSAKALFRTNMSLKHSILYIQEVAGSEGADFSIRTLQSDNVLKWEATEKQADGTLANVEYEVEGPTVIVQTTTHNHLHPENETRVVPIYLDESPAQTKRINDEAKKCAAGKRGVSSDKEREMCAAWHDAIRLLEPAEVVIPFAERIEVPDKPLRLRRDLPRLLNIIRLITWVHQHTRARDAAGRIVATEADFQTAIEVVGDSFARAWKSFTPSEEGVYEAITNHVSERLRKQGFKRSHVESALKADKVDMPSRTVKDALYTLASSGFLESDGKRGASGATYTVAKSASPVGGLKLAPATKDPPTPSAHSPIRPKSGESGVGKTKGMGNSDSAHSRPLPIQEDADEDGMGNGHKRAKGSLPIQDALPMPKNTDFEGNGQMGKGRIREDKNEGEQLDYEYTETE